jgi:hypothetical protein
MTSNSKITLDSQCFSKYEKGNNTDEIDQFFIYDNDYFNTKYGGIKKKYNNTNIFDIRYSKYKNGASHLTNKFDNFKKMPLIYPYHKKGNLFSEQTIVIDTRSNYNLQKYFPNHNTYLYSQYLRKKYPNYRVKNYLIEPYKPEVNNYDDNDTINDKSECLMNPAMNFINAPKINISRTLYGVLNEKKNRFYDQVNIKRQIEIEKIPELRKKQIKMVNDPNSKFYKRLSNLNDFLKPPVKTRIPFIHHLTYENMTISEKTRYQNYLEILYKLKGLIERSPLEETIILKDFLTSNGIINVKSIDIQQLNNFSNYIKKKKLKIDTKKNFKENIMDIINGKYYQEEEFYKPLIKKESGIKIVLNKNENINNLNKEENKKNISKKNLTSIDLYCKSDIITNLNKQTLINLKHKSEKELDIVNNPKEIIEIIEKDFEQTQKDKEQKFIKTLPYFNKINISNENLYGTKNQSNEYDELIKENKLTDYICLLKAKNNLQENNLKEQYEKK